MSMAGSREGGPITAEQDRRDSVKIPRPITGSHLHAPGGCLFKAGPTGRSSRLLVESQVDLELQLLSPPLLDSNPSPSSTPPLGANGHQSLL